MTRGVMMTTMMVMMVMVSATMLGVQCRHVGTQSRVKAWINALPESLIQRLEADIEHVNRFEEQFGTLKNYKKRTRWFPAGARPRTALEEAIVRLKEIAKPERGSDMVYAGAEWWVQVVDAAGQKGKIGFHVDKDEAVASLEHYLLHPVWGSIFYLTDSGGCTLILDQHSPKGNGYYPELAEEGELVCPQRNKYAQFNGTLLHGVIPGREEHVVEPRRVTFLVNWWHVKPKAPNCEKLPHKKVEGLKYLSKKKLRRLRETVEREEAENPTPKRRRTQPKVVDLRPNARVKLPSYEHPFDLPGGRKTSAMLPRDIESGQTYTIRWRDLEGDAKARGKREL